MKISTKSNAAAVAKDWKRLGKVYKKAVISGLNKAAYRVANEDMPGIMRQGIDRPVSFTHKKPAFYRRAKEGNPRAFVQIKDIQAGYLERIVFGGRGRKGKAVPVGVRLNKFGNIASLRAGKKVNALLAKPNHFQATFNGVTGIFKRVGGRLEMLIYFSQGDYKYRKSFDWHRYTRKAADKQLPKAMNEAINKVLIREAARSVSR